MLQCTPVLLQCPRATVTVLISTPVLLLHKTSRGAHAPDRATVHARAKQEIINLVKVANPLPLIYGANLGQLFLHANQESILCTWVSNN